MDLPLSNLQFVKKKNILFAELYLPTAHQRGLAQLRTHRLPRDFTENVNILVSVLTKGGATVEALGADCLTSKTQWQ